MNEHKPPVEYSDAAEPIAENETAIADLRASINEGKRDVEELRLERERLLQNSDAKEEVDELDRLIDQYKNEIAEYEGILEAVVAQTNEIKELDARRRELLSRIELKTDKPN